MANCIPSETFVDWCDEHRRNMIKCIREQENQLISIKEACEFLASELSSLTSLMSETQAVKDVWKAYWKLEELIPGTKSYKEKNP